MSVIPVLDPDSNRYLAYVNVKQVTQLNMY